MATFLKDYAGRVIANGYKIIPIQPGKKFPTFKGWQKEDADQPRLDNWLANGHAHDGLGILTKFTPFADHDSKNVAFLRFVQDWITINIGMAPCRIGNAPKRGYLFKLAGPPFRKLATPIYIDPDGLKAQLEFLADGQQFVSNHIHPDTEKPYRWLRGESPATILRDDLPEVTEELAKQAIAAAAAWMRKQGWKLANAKEEGEPGFIDDASDDELDPNSTEPLGLPEEKIRAYVMRVPNDETVPYEGKGLSWLSVMAAIHHETDGSDTGKQIALEWSEQSSKHEGEPGRFEKTWRSFTTGEERRLVTFRHVIKLARELDKRPTIVIEAGELPRMTDEAEAALITGDAPIYTRAPHLVRPIIETVDAANGHKTRVARLVRLGEDSLIDYFSQTAKWDKFDGRLKKRCLTNPPRDVAGSLMSRDGDWKLPPLVGVINTPTLRGDGSVLSGAGYDAATRLLLMQPPRMPDIPEKPNLRRAKEALQLLDDLLSQFPFVDDASRSVALSCLMTPVLRGAIPVAPLHLARAPVAGSGKSYLMNLASTIATGQLCPVMTAARDDGMEKRLGACMLAGDTIINIDNLNGELGGDFICQCIEQTRVQVRILGKSERVTIESRTTFFATGNNLAVHGDMVRRTIVCSLDPEMERPELRVFPFNPVDRVLGDRGRYIAAVLTIARAYQAAGMPGLLAPLASFGEWSRLVRSPLVWLGRTDPVVTIERSREEDPTLNQLRLFLNSWREEIGMGFDNRKTAAEILNLIRETPSFDDDEKSGVASALATIGADAHKLGMWLHRNKGRVVD